MALLVHLRGGVSWRGGGGVGGRRRDGLRVPVQGFGSSLGCRVSRGRVPLQDTGSQFWLPGPLLDVRSQSGVSTSNPTRRRSGCGALFGHPRGKCVSTPATPPALRRLWLFSCPGRALLPRRARAPTPSSSPVGSGGCEHSRGQRALRYRPHQEKRKWTDSTTHLSRDQGRTVGTRFTQTLKLPIAPDHPSRTRRGTSLDALLGVRCPRP